MPMLELWVRIQRAECDQPRWDADQINSLFSLWAHIKSCRLVLINSIVLLQLVQRCADTVYNITGVKERARGKYPNLRCSLCIVPNLCYKPVNTNKAKQWKTAACFFIASKTTELIFTEATVSVYLNVAVLCFAGLTADRLGLGPGFEDLAQRTGDWQTRHADPIWKDIRASRVSKRSRGY